MYPSYSPWQTATYSNIAYQLLAYALESISGKKFIDILNDQIIKPLRLNHTYYENAPPSVGILPSSIKDTYWNVSLGDASPYVQRQLVNDICLYTCTVVGICIRQLMTYLPWAVQYS